MTGVIACVAVLLAASVFGVVWKRRNGRIRPVAAPAAPGGSVAPATSGDPVAPAVPGGPAASAAPGCSPDQAPAGATVDYPPAPDAPSGPAAGTPAETGTLTETELGRPLGARATLVQFSTAFCAPCRATRVILADVAGRTEGVAHVEIDAESHLELVRRLDIRRTPTVLVLGPDGRIAQRGSGQPRKADVLAVIGRM